MVVKKLLFLSQILGEYLVVKKLLFVSHILGEYLDKDFNVIAQTHKRNTHVLLAPRSIATSHTPRRTCCRCPICRGTSTGHRPRGRRHIGRHRRTHPAAFNMETVAMEMRCVGHVLLRDSLKRPFRMTEV